MLRGVLHLLARRCRGWLALVVITLCGQAAIARAGDATPPASAAAAPASASAPFDADKANAAAQIQDPEAATRAYLDSVSPERRAKTKSYARGSYVLHVVDFVFSSAVLVLLLALGISVRFRDLARRVTRRPALQNALYWIQFFVAVSVVQLPLTLYAEYYREKHYGLLTQDLGGFLADQGKGLVIGCVAGAILMMILYGVLRRAPRLWWVWGSAVVTAFLVFTIAIAPVVISPLFNKFTPVEDAAIRDRILAMAHEQGIPADEVYQVDASRRTDRVSAYVNGMLGTMRIVMFDTTLKRCTPEEIQMIMGHEMGHYVLNHVWKSVGFFALLIVLAFLFVRWGFVRVVGRWPGLGLEGIADIAGLPLLTLLFSV
ncbi:MAG TPA: M48 family metallopeptidase, partial [Kofleriaceae bacterium]|nr:M48 family metallopeptidase [Kofleriaceae bacterium]